MTEKAARGNRLPGGRGSKARTLAFLLKNLGVVVQSQEIEEASGCGGDWMRVLSELRNGEEYWILLHRDRADLKPGEYLLETDEWRPVLARSLSKECRSPIDQLAKISRSKE